MSFKKNFYVEEKYIPNLLKYKYTGVDNSIYYKYVISPICDKITNYLPEWLLPNTITTIGWALNLISFILTIYYGGWKGCDYFPPWVCYLCSINYSLYIYIDAIDGKQARRLKASTPLGVLFDHGCDACTSFFITLTACSCFYYNNIYQYLLVFIPLTFTFFLNFIEEYYTGVLDLPIINGVEEGSIYVSLIFFLSGYYGPNFYNTQYKVFNKYNLKISEINGIAVFIGAMLHCLKCLYDIIQKVGKNKVKDIFKSCFIYIVFISSLLSVILLNDSIIVKEYPKLFILCYGILIAKVYCIMQVCQIINSPLSVNRPIFLIPMLILFAHSIFYYLFKYSLFISVDILIITSLIINFFSWLHYVYFCSEEMCEALNINRFVPGKKYSNRPAYGESAKKLE